jgi:hypothetical protein
MRIIVPGIWYLKVVGLGSGTREYTKKAHWRCHLAAHHSGLMDYVGKLDIQSIRVLIYFHFTLLVRTFLVDATIHLRH